ncbi:SIMPL domain-containing protein [Xanthobacter autotrophicus DSM 431]|uniref:SIMPL domain-containing protein n=1 Tax=Xanthobacter nonsaccharivorans TaxID=3119912 RepID=UPI0037278CF5
MRLSFRPSHSLGPVLAAALTSVMVLSVPAAAATLTVVGEAKVSAAPDMAVLTTGTVTSAKSADEALAANSKAVTAVIETLKGAGIASKDIATANFSVQPQYAYSQGNREPPKLTGFEVRNQVRITVRQLDTLGPLLDKVMQSGANQASGLSFSLSDLPALEREARLASVKEAMEQAKALAGAAGLRLTRINSIQPESLGGPVLPPPMMMMKADAASRAPVPVEAGEIDVRARTVIVYEVEPQ